MILELCPRCGREEFTPRDQHGVPLEQIMEYPYPALSRVARIDICTPCGQDEAMRNFRGAPPIPPDEWPIKPEAA